MAQRLFFIIAFITLAVSQMSDCSSVLAAQDRQNTAAEVASIEKEVKRVEQFMKQKTSVKRIAANLARSDEKQTRWRIFNNEAEFQKEAGEGNLEGSAYVWLKNGHVVTAAFTFQTESGDWVHFITYYYREDGTLAKLDAQLNTFYGRQSVLRKSYYDNHGQLLKQTVQYRDLQTKRPNKPNDDFIDEPIPDYLKVSQLPFYGLVTKGG